MSNIVPANAQALPISETPDPEFEAAAKAWRDLLDRLAQAKANGDAAEFAHLKARAANHLRTAISHPSVSAGH